jgi:hypothetical protein
MAWRGALVAGIRAGAPDAGHTADLAPGAAIQHQLRSFATTGRSSTKIFKKPYDDLTNKGLKCEMGQARRDQSPPERDHYNSRHVTGFPVHPHPDPKRREPGANLPVSASHIRTYILDIASFQGGIDSSSTKRFVVHLAKGVRGDRKSLTEFTTLKSKNLLASGTAVIHGAAFGETEFSRWVWQAPS